MNPVAVMVTVAIGTCLALGQPAAQESVHKDGEKGASMSIEADRAFEESKRTERFDAHAIHEGVTRLSDLIFTSVNGRDLKCDLTFRDARPREPRPAIVFLHGGSWMLGNQKQFGREAASLAKYHNFIAMQVDYRLSGEAKFPAALQDAKAAIRWLRANAQTFNIDPERIAVAGGSAGGHLSAMVATTAGVKEYEGDGGYPNHSSHVNAAILYNGEFDMADLVRKHSLIEPMAAFYGGTPEEVPEVYAAASPIKRVHKDCPPMLFLHGDQDQCVSHEQALAMRDKLLSVGVHSEAVIFQGKPHAWFNKDEEWAEAFGHMERFLVNQFAPH